VENKCPKCGAGYTNSEKCAYCGSLLSSHMKEIKEDEENQTGIKSITSSQNFDYMLAGIGLDSVFGNLFDDHHPEE